jgi:hypothetical protein
MKNFLVVVFMSFGLTLAAQSGSDQLSELFIYIKTNIQMQKLIHHQGLGNPMSK